MTTTKDVQEAFARVNYTRDSFTRGMLTDPTRLTSYLRDLGRFENTIRAYAMEHGLEDRGNFDRPLFVTAASKL